MCRTPQRISEDHRLDNSKKEQERVKAEGGRVDYHGDDDNKGPLRLWPGSRSGSIYRIVRIPSSILQPPPLVVISISLLFCRWVDDVKDTW
jgi:hypothetical protein